MECIVVMKMIRIQQQTIRKLKKNKTGKRKIKNNNKNKN